MKKNKCVAMILAGGQGSRLGVLTKQTAKPSVPFGGRYRIIDFPISNCLNSDIGTIGVLTQYRPHELNRYINRSSLNIERRQGGIFVLPPYMHDKGGHWYTGTADAIHQNKEFVDSYHADHVLILSGDHIYKMNYRKMLEFHLENDADATIAVIEVPWETANRFGIMNVDPTINKITEFEEKPKEPKSNLASMGIYIFKWDVLRDYLNADADDEMSEHDFGKNVIPAMLGDNKRMFAYNFNGYWRDVGTIRSLWEANMDLLADEPEFDLMDYSWRIYGDSPTLPPHYIDPKGKVDHSIIHDGCDIRGTVINSVIFSGVTVEEGAVVEDSVVMDFVKIGKDCRVRKAIIGQNTSIAKGLSVSNPEGLISVIGESTCVTSRNIRKSMYDENLKAGE